MVESSKASNVSKSQVKSKIRFDKFVVRWNGRGRDKMKDIEVCFVFVLEKDTGQRAGKHQMCWKYCLQEKCTRT